jgi:hypothetical protein
MPMRMRDLYYSVVAVWGLILAAAPGRSQSTARVRPAMPVPPALPAMVPALVAPLSPAEIALPPMPAAPASPAAPAAPAISWTGPHARHHDGPASDWSDLHVEFHNELAAIESEERTLSKAEAKVLRVDELENGGMQVQWWDKESHSVTACKAADATRGNAKQLLSEIKLSVQGGQVSVTGRRGTMTGRCTC